MSTRSDSSPSPVPSLAHAFGGVWRLTFRRCLQPSHWLALALGMGILGLLLFAVSLRANGVHRLMDWIIGVYITTLVPVIAFMTAAGTLRDEMKSVTVDYVLTRPIPRPAFILFKYISHALCMQVYFLLTLGVAVGFAGYCGIPGLATLSILFLLGQVLLVFAFSALGFLCGSLSSRYVVIGLAYAMIIEVGVGQIPTQLSRLSMTHLVKGMLRSLTNHSETLASAPSVLGATSMSFLFCLITLGIATALFSLREIANSAES